MDGERRRRRRVAWAGSLAALAVLVLAAPAAAVSPAPTVRGFEDLPPRPGYTGLYPEDLVWSDGDAPGCATVQSVPHASSPPNVFRHFCDPLQLFFVRPQAYVAMRVNPQPFQSSPGGRPFTMTARAFHALGALVAERVLPVREGETTSFFLADPAGVATISYVTYEMSGDYSDIDDLAYSPSPQPDSDIVEAPASPTAATTARFAITATPGAALECTLDGAAVVPCASPKDIAGIGEGTHVFTVTAVDSYGARELTPAQATWTVDLTAPDTAIDDGPPGATGATTATFRFSAPEPVAGFECRLDAAAFATCASPVTLSGLADGRHDFEVRAVDAVGNRDATPARRGWEVTAAGGAPDRDDDGVADRTDNCPGTANPAQADGDADDIGDTCEVLPPGNVPPVAGRVTVAREVSGRVLVRLPGRGLAQSGFVPLKGVASLPVGTVVDARKGRLALATAADYRATGDPRHEVQRGRFAAAIFAIRQARRRQSARRAATNLVMQTPGRLTRACASRQTRPIRGIVRTFAGTATGLFRTVGGASTVTTNPARAVSWRVQDRCDGTFTSVSRGRATVFDRRLKRTVAVRAGREYIARARLFGARPPGRRG